MKPRYMVAFKSAPQVYLLDRETETVNLGSQRLLLKVDKIQRDLLKTEKIPSSNTTAHYKQLKLRQDRETMVQRMLQSRGKDKENKKEIRGIASASVFSPMPSREDSPQSSLASGRGGGGFVGKGYVSEKVRFVASSCVRQLSQVKRA